MLTFEDFKPGHFGTFGPRHVTREEIIAFAREFDPQPMHLDEEAANRSMLRGLSGSGWHMCALMMRMLVDGFIGIHRVSACAGRRGIALAVAAAARRQPDARRRGAGDAGDAQPARRGPRQIHVTPLSNAGEKRLTMTTNAMFRLKAAATGRRRVSYLEDIKVGVNRELGSFTFTADAIKDFARQFDPQPFHLDEAAGRASLFGGLAASGWHLTAVFMKLLVSRMRRREQAAAKARGEEIAPGGPSPGFKNMRWLKPVLAGDTLTLLHRGEGDAAIGVAPAMGPDGRRDHGVQPARRAGVLVRERGVSCRGAIPPPDAFAS
jgi:acyl dehydratase